MIFTIFVKGLGVHHHPKGIPPFFSKSKRIPTFLVGLVSHNSSYFSNLEIIRIYALYTTKTDRKTNMWKHYFWLVVSTHLKHISQIGSSPQVGVKIKKVWMVFDGNP